MVGWNIQNLILCSEKKDGPWKVVYSNSNFLHLTDLGFEILIVAVSQPLCVLPALLEIDELYQFHFQDLNL